MMPRLAGNRAGRAGVRIRYSAIMSASEQPTPPRPGFAADFTAALGFFTCIPVAAPAGAGWPLAGAVWAFPLVGAGIGAVAALVYLAGQLVRLGDWPSALLAVLAGMLLTGALHEDGLADAADGIFGGRDRDRRLAIMRDSRHGTFAVLALVLSVGLRAAALAQIGQAVFAGLALIAAHTASRALLPAAMWLMPSARAQGLGAEAGRPLPARIGAGLLIALAIAAAALGPVTGLLAVTVAAAAATLAGRLAQQRVGGYTGDVLGALQQCAEIAILLTAVASR